MAMMKVTYVSDHIKDMVNLYLIIPQRKLVRSAAAPQMQPGSFREEYPVLLLLHEEASSPLELATMSSIRRYAEKHGIMVAMPEGMLSYFTDYAVRDLNTGNSFGSNASIEANFTELCYESALNEVMAIIRQALPGTASPEKTFLAGIGSGGFAALKHAAKYPEQFAAVFSLNGITDLQRFMDDHPDRKEQFEAVFGGCTACGENDLPAAYAALAGKPHPPRVYQIYTPDDPERLQMNERFGQVLSPAYPDYHAAVLPGIPDWDWVDLALERIFDELCEQDNEKE